MRLHTRCTPLCCFTWLAGAATWRVACGAWLVLSLQGCHTRALVMLLCCCWVGRAHRYKKAADWQLISEIVAASSLPIIGNGDILTHYEAADRCATRLSHVAKCDMNTAVSLDMVCNKVSLLVQRRSSVRRSAVLPRQCLTPRGRGLQCIFCCAWCP